MTYRIYCVLYCSRVFDQNIISRFSTVLLSSLMIFFKVLHGGYLCFFIICFGFGNCACAHIYGEESFCVRIRRAVAITLQAAAMYCCKKQCLCNGRWVKYEREAKCANFLTLQCHFQQSVEEESVIFF